MNEILKQFTPNNITGGQHRLETIYRTKSDVCCCLNQNTPNIE